MSSLVQQSETPVTVTQTPAVRPKPRFPLFTKIVSSFVIIIVFMVFSSIFILLQLREALLSSKTEVLQHDESIILSQQLERLFNSEQSMARSYMLSNEIADSQKYAEAKEQVHVSLDSLHQLTSRADIQSHIGKLSERHDRLDEVVLRQPFDSTRSMLLVQQQLMSDSLRNSIISLYESYRVSLGKSLKMFELRTNLSVKAALLVLVLSLAVALVTSVMLARTVTRPIHALQATTEKVAVGNYEIMQVTSNDEVADLTRAFNMMSGKLKELDDLRMNMMSEISHEMRSPLSVILAACQLIVRTKDGPPLTKQQSDAIGMIQNAAKRINNFVNSFLDIAKMEAGLMTFHFETIDLIELVNPMVQEAKLIAQTRNISVDFLKTEVHPLELDKERMVQVVTNLFSNALKYTPDGGTISLQIFKLEQFEGIRTNGRGCVRIDVKDSGVGIPADDIKKLFNKFFQANNTPLVKQKGSGLGLALVKHVAEAHGGKVSVESQVGVGSTFSIILPA